MTTRLYYGSVSAEAIRQNGSQASWKMRAEMETARRAAEYYAK